MADLIPTASYTNIGTVGTVALTTGDGHALYRAIIAGTYIGSVAIYDSATIAGTSASNLITTLGLPSSTFPESIEFGIRVKNGLTYASTGTPSVILVWS